jgi:MFS family permease
MSRRALIALGIGQCVNWGVLYYAFAVLLLPLERELQQPTWVVTGAFSLALLMSAVLAPHVGRWCDRGGGAAVMQTGGVAAAAVLGLWTLVPGVAALYAAWFLLGLCMAATLYEPAFIVIARAYPDPQPRLRALAAVTLFGGLASTIFLPSTAFLVSRFGWRMTVLTLAAAVAVSTAMTKFFTFTSDERPPESSESTPGVGPEPHGGLGRIRFSFLASLFALTTLAGAGFAANLVPALTERGLSPANAALLGGLIGVMQLPGRALLLNGAAGATAAGLLTLSLILHAAGFLGVALAPTIVLVATGTAVFALGAGLTTLVRPHLVHEMTDGRGGGYVNGWIARRQQFARAAGPLAIATLASAIGYTGALAVLAACFVVGAIGWQVTTLGYSPAVPRRLDNKGA